MRWGAERNERCSRSKANVSAHAWSNAELVWRGKSVSAWEKVIGPKGETCGRLVGIRKDIFQEIVRWLRYVA